MLRLGASWLILVLVIIVYHNNRGDHSAWAKGKFDWMAYDHFDEINDHFSSINADNCRNKDKSQLVMRKDVVAQLPVYNELLSRIWYKNRSSLIHIHNMALNRAFFYSYVLQKMNSTDTFYKQPNWMYFYFSATADVNANPFGLNGSAFYFDTDCHYPNWYTTLPFNRTIPLFGPKAFRWDDFSDQDNFLREPTRQVVQAVDLGAGRFMNYTHAGFKMNPWYRNWLPDVKGDMDSLTKFTYYIGIKESNVTGRFITDEFENYAFFGPNSPSASDRDERLLPVQFTAPYFDCGGSNKWVVSAVAPVVDFMPRYSNFTHLRRQRIVGVTVMDTDLIKLDFNACGVSPGNPGPSYLSGIARCRPSTGCKHKMGYGFRRGGYVCVCKSGWRYPFFIERPFQGDNVEQSTEEEYYNGFQCTPTDYRLVLPVVDQLSGVSIEGGGVAVNSAGLPLDLAGQGRRRRRETENTTTTSVSAANDHHSANVRTVTNASAPSHQQTLQFSIVQRTPDRTSEDRHVVDNSDGIAHGIIVMKGATTNDSLEGVREPSPHEMIALAERIRELGESQKLQKYLDLQGSRYRLDISANTREDDYAERNNVDISVEKEYESDVKQHKIYKDFLIEADRASGKPNGSRVAEMLRDDIVQMRERHEQRFHANRLSAGARRRKKRAAVYDDLAFDRMMRILRWKSSVNKANCHQMPNHRLVMPGDVGYGAHAQFENEGRTALRLSNFLSMYLQNVMPEENFGNLRGGGPLHKDMMFGEVLANVMGNYRIYAAGVFFDRYKFENDDGSARELFGPWAFRKQGAFYAEDQAGYSLQYVDSDWFRQAKARHGANFFGVKRYKLRAYVRSDPKGTSSVRHEFFPIIYRAAPYEVGFWTKPYFRCDGKVDAWVMTYVSPFFGLDSLRTRLEFRGVTTVDVPLSFLELNQCPMPFTVANAFKNTARCDYLSTKCRPQAGFLFMRGSYMCTCRMGFEYWHSDGKFWIEGSLLELEYEKKRAGIFSRFDHLTCRRGQASGLDTGSLPVILSLVTLALVSNLGVLLDWRTP